mgnify:CR=1 FL=1
MNRREDNPRYSKHERQTSRRYLLEVVPGLVVMLGSMLLLTQVSDLKGDPVLRTLAAWAAVAGAGWIVIAVWRHLRRAAEYETRALLVTLSISFATTTLTAFGLGLASLVGARVDASEWLVLAVGLMTWCIAGVVTTKR